VIVDPDFLDHWRTGMVVDALGDAMAPLYILRLWAHCQERKSDAFVMPTRGLKAQCKFPGDAQAFEAALIEAGFISRDGDSIYVCGWAEKNASLLAAWANGNKGGRPKKAQKEPSENPRVTQQEPTANPSETHAEPIREEKRREEPSSLRSEGKARKRAVTCPADVPEQVWQDFQAIRAAKRAPLTDTAVDGIAREAAKAGIDLATALAYCCERGWQGFNAGWYAARQQAAAKAPARSEHVSFAEQERRAGWARWEEMTGQSHPELEKLRQGGEFIDALPNNTTPRIEHVAAH
jgi:hypothetical protein